jgi:hypothetical protein
MGLGLGMGRDVRERLGLHGLLVTHGSIGSDGLIDGDFLDESYSRFCLCYGSRDTSIHSALLQAIFIFWPAIGAVVVFDTHDASAS